jgi:prepilin-type processing-associated H-X9-DG protein
LYRFGSVTVSFADGNVEKKKMNSRNEEKSEKCEEGVVAGDKK